MRHNDDDDLVPQSVLCLLFLCSIAFENFGQNKQNGHHAENCHLPITTREKKNEAKKHPIFIR